MEKRTSEGLGSPAIVYTRISADPEGRAVGVERQTADCLALADRLGFEVVDVVTDNDLSASTASAKPRPQYDAMLARVRRGEATAILAYSNSRLTRRPREFEDLLDLHRATGVRISTVVSGEDDLSTADGRMVARFKAVADAAEAERTAERVKRAKAQAAKDGRYRGGPRPFGYEADGMTVRESEARIVRETTTALLAGRSLRALVAELNDAGVATPQGKRWTNRALKQVIVRPRNAALISSGPADRFGMQIVGRAQWDAIVDEDTFLAVRDLLMKPERRSSHTTEVRHLGSGIYLCGKCGAPMRPGLLPRLKGESEDAPRRFQYRCVEQLHLTVTAEPTDDHVRREVAAFLRDPRVVAALAPATLDLTQDRERRTVLTARLEHLQREWDDDLIDTRDYNRKRGKIEAELAEVDARLAEGLRRSTASPVLGARDPGKAFLDAPLDIQRALVRSLVRVEVLPSGPGKKWSSDRLDITRVGAA
jgi:DNA invertase Pin-like site-specific DNA recombinase